MFMMDVKIILRFTYTDVSGGETYTDLLDCSLLCLLAPTSSQLKNNCLNRMWWFTMEKQLVPGPQQDHWICWKRA